MYFHTKKFMLNLAGKKRQSTFNRYLNIKKTHYNSRIKILKNDHAIAKKITKNIERKHRNPRMSNI